LSRILSVGIPDYKHFIDRRAVYNMLKVPQEAQKLVKELRLSANRARYQLSDCRNSFAKQLFVDRSIIRALDNQAVGQARHR